jgi:3'-phosphoadenosine 5'-phosphosulfate sulfotransferase (PAPS reductase)/FAD synthetase
MIHIARFSGGRDSTIMLIKLLEEGIEPIVTFSFVTGNMLEESINHVNRVLDAVNNKYGTSLELHIIMSEDFCELMRTKHKPFPNFKTLWCEYWLKQVPFTRWLRRYLVKQLGYKEEEIVVNIGVKLSDSKRRRDIYEKALRNNGYIRAYEVKTRRGYVLDNGRYWLRFPILTLTDEDVKKILDSHPRIRDAVEEGYRKLVNPSSCLACPFHTWKGFYTKAPKHLLIEIKKKLEECASLPHIRNFRLGYQTLQKQLEYVNRALSSNT